MPKFRRALFATERTVRSFVLQLLLVALFLCASAQAADRYDRFLDEVHWIASKNELAGFESLKSDSEKDAFIDEFWALRDPTPGTPQNEYKNEHYKRFEYANKFFREGGAGWRTDRGRVLILHGPPDLEEFRDLPTRGRSGTRRRRQSIVWTYFEIPSARYYRGRIAIIFQPSIGITEQEFTLGESRQALEQAENQYRRAGVRESDLIDVAVKYRLISAGPPTGLTSRGIDVPSSGIGDNARHIEDILRSPGEALEGLREEEERQAASRAQLRQEISTQISFAELPLAMTSQSFAGPEQSTLVVTWQFPLESVDFEKAKGLVRGRVDLMAQVQDSSGSMVDEFFRTIELVYPEDQFKSIQNDDYRYVNEFHLPAGQYSVLSIARDVRGQKAGYFQGDTEVVDSAGDRLRLSGLVLSRTLADPSGVVLGRDLITNDWQVIPEPDQTFSNAEKLVLFFKIYGAKVADDAPELFVSYNFMVGEKVVKESGPRQVTNFDGLSPNAASYSTIIDLLGFEPGLYRLQVTVVETRSKQYAIERSEFRVTQ